ncbi:hypothetical protein [Aliiroseovarius sp. S1123]|uniref:hypothetical protein n=1 Tax=unclassified Aliiroseovarius TaxID=2623558 RepID=UPI001FF194CF|nr:hypothetical protein [Aliiroseovarius sp. S1123]MCK0170633.1 hypothetical protein [Aliiroseovarius sp. S1123]
MNKIFAAVLAMSTFVPMAAQAEVYVCELAPSGASDGGWIPPQTVVEFDANTGKATVFDGLIKDVYEKPIAAKISVNNNKRYTFTWNVRNVEATSTESKRLLVKNMAYRLTITKGSLQATETMKPVGYANTFRAKGKCVQKK